MSESSVEKSFWLGRLRVTLRYALDVFWVVDDNYGLRHTPWVFAGSVRSADAGLSVIIVGPFMLSWGLESKAVTGAGD